MTLCETYLATHAYMDRNKYIERHLGAKRLPAATHTLRHTCRHTHTHTFALWYTSTFHTHTQQSKFQSWYSQKHTSVQTCSSTSSSLHHVVPNLEGGPSLEQRGGSPDADSTTAWEGEGGQSHPGTWELSGNHSPVTEMEVGERLPVPYPEPSSTTKGQQTWTRA